METPNSTIEQLLANLEHSGYWKQLLGLIRMELRESDISGVMETNIQRDRYLLKELMVERLFDEGETPLLKEVRRRDQIYPITRSLATQLAAVEKFGQRLPESKYKKLFMEIARWIAFDEKVPSQVYYGYPEIPHQTKPVLVKLIQTAVYGTSQIRIGAQLNKTFERITEIQERFRKLKEP